MTVAVLGTLYAATCGSVCCSICWCSDTGATSTSDPGDVHAALNRLRCCLGPAMQVMPHFACSQVLNTSIYAATRVEWSQRTGTCGLTPVSMAHVQHMHPSTDCCGVQDLLPQVMLPAAVLVHLICCYVLCPLL